MDGCRVGRRRKTGAEVDGCRVEQRWMDVEGRTGAEVDGCRVGREGRLEQRWMDVEWGGKEDWSRGGWM